MTVQYLQGVVDAHIHGYPEMSLKVENSAYDHIWLQQAIQAGMRGVCLKSHYVATTDNAFLLSQLYPEIAVSGSITLNHTVGGLNPYAVRVAIENGAKVVWFPTWGAANDIEKNGYSSRVREFYGWPSWPALRVYNENGQLLPEVLEIIDLIAAADITLASGHLSIDESKVLFAEAKKRGVKRMVFTHALTAMVNASLPEQIAIADMGVLIEHTYVATRPQHQRLAPAEIFKSIRAVGAERCLISSDSVYSWNPSPPEMMRMFIDDLTALGMSRDELVLLTNKNPCYVLGLSA